MVTSHLILFCKFIKQEDTLVVSVGSDFQLNHGKVAQAIAAHAGPRLQAACNSLRPINIGEVKETDGFRLPCKKILHCNCPEYDGFQSLSVNYLLSHMVPVMSYKI